MDPLLTSLTVVLFAAAPLTFVALLFMTAPYGRHVRAGWGPMLSSRVGWILMELPAVLWFCIVFTLGRHRGELVPLVLLALWLTHYGYRTFIFPFRIPSSDRRMPLSVAAMGFTFNLLNGYVNARFVSDAHPYQSAWLGDPRFAIGAVLFVIGLSIHVRADARLLMLKRQGRGYVLPRGGLFELVCQPNYFGELVQWSGFALAAWSLPALGFALYTFANLAPRALSHRRWYRETFPELPARRKAIIPFVM